MTSKSKDVLPTRGGSYVRQTKGGLKQTDGPAINAKQKSDAAAKPATDEKET